MALARKARAPAPTEKAIHSAVVDHWKLLGRPVTLVATLANAFAHGQPGLTPGLPDLIVLGPNVPGKIAFLELKSERGKASEAQLTFATLCAKLGVLCPIVHGRDEPIAFLERWGVVREQRRPEPPESRRLELKWP